MESVLDSNIEINKIMFTQEEILSRVKELGERITKDYQGKN